MNTRHQSHPDPGSDADPNPLQLIELQFRAAESRVLTAAVQLDVFTHIARGASTAATVAAAAAADPRAMRMLLDAAAVLGLLRKQGEAYALTPLSARYLAENSPDYLGEGLKLDRHWPGWTHLADAVRAGRPPRAGRPQGERFAAPALRGMYAQNRPAAERLGQALSPALPPSARVLDVACGSAVWSLALARAQPALRVTALDFPPVLELAREFIARENAAAQYEFLPGDMHAVALEPAAYDLILLANVAHSAGEAKLRQLLHRLAAALRPGGRLAIVDMIPDPERTGPLLPVIFALNLLLHTEQGDAYTLGQYRAWLEAAGFEPPATIEIGWASPALLARRR